MAPSWAQGSRRAWSSMRSRALSLVQAEKGEQDTCSSTPLLCRAPHWQWSRSILQYSNTFRGAGRSRERARIENPTGNDPALTLRAGPYQATTQAGEQGTGQQMGPISPHEADAVVAQYLRCTGREETLAAFRREAADSLAFARPVRGQCSESVDIGRFALRGPGHSRCSAGRLTLRSPAPGPAHPAAYRDPRGLCRNVRRPEAPSPRDCAWIGACGRDVAPHSGALLWQAAHAD